MCIRIHEFAKERKIDVKDVIDFCGSLGHQNLTHLSGIPKECLQQVEEHFPKKEEPSAANQPNKAGESKEQNPDLTVALEKIKQLEEDNKKLAEQLKNELLKNATPIPVRAEQGDDSQQEPNPSDAATAASFDINALIDALADRVVARKNENSTVPVKAEPIPNTPAACEGYYWDPDPAWGYAAAAVGGAGLLVLLAKIFGGK